jgi:hypothetical protein
VETLLLNINGKRHKCTLDIFTDSIRVECWVNCPFLDFALGINGETEDSYIINYIWYDTDNIETSLISLEILESEEFIHTIDPKYLPKSVVDYTTIKSINVVESVDEVTITSTYMNGTNSIRTITKDSNGNPASIIIDGGTPISITWTEAYV